MIASLESSGSARRLLSAALASGLAVLVFLSIGQGAQAALAPRGLPVEAEPSFADITSGPLGDMGYSQGVAWGDYDNDGNLDLYLVTYSGANRLFHNKGGGVFEDVTSGPLGDTAWGIAAVWGDYDNDGDLDLYLTNLGSANRLFRNDGGVFADATSGPLGDTGQGSGAAWGDYDNDGDLDLYLSNYGQANKLFRNEGGPEWSFADATSGPLGDAGNGACAAWGDYDNDGDLDLYLVNYGSANKLFRNDGGTWTDVTSEPLGNVGNGTYATWGDYDNDGDLDLYVSNEGQANVLLRNTGGPSWSFVDATSAPLGDAGMGMAVAWGDYDNDGDLDLYLSNNGQANKLFRNEGGPEWTFVDATSGPLGNTGAGRGAAWGDIDNDGDLDLYFAVSGAANKLLRNDNLTGNHWLQVNLRGVLSNRSGIGARVRVEAGGMSRMETISGGSASQNSLTADFGLGAAATIDSLIVRWPSGIVWDTTGVAVDQALTVVERASSGSLLVSNLGAPIAGEGHAVWGQWWAAPFVTDSRASQLASITLTLTPYQLPEPDLSMVRVYADDGTGQPGSVVGELVSPALPYLQRGDYVFTAATSITLQPATRYFVGIGNRAGGGVGADDRASWHYTASAASTGPGNMPGGVYLSLTQGATWQLWSSDRFLFRVDVTGALPSLLIGDTQVQEGNAGNTSMVFPISLSAPASEQVRVDYATADGTATAANGDYIPTTGTVVIERGAVSGSIEVQVIGDVVEEPDETCRVILSNPSGAPLAAANAEATGTILNDDGLKPDLQVENLAYDAQSGGLTAVARNAGRTPAAGTRVVFQDRSPALGGGAGSTIRSVTVGPLPIGGMQDVSATWTPGVGAQVIAAVIDPDNAIAELAELNNSIERNFGTMGHRPRIEDVRVKYGEKFSTYSFGNYIVGIDGVAERFTAIVSDLDRDVTAVLFRFEIDDGDTTSRWAEKTKTDQDSTYWSVTFDVGKLKYKEPQIRNLSIVAYDAGSLSSNRYSGQIHMMQLPWWMKNLAITAGCDTLPGAPIGSVVGVTLAGGYATFTFNYAPAKAGQSSFFCKKPVDSALPPSLPILGGKKTETSNSILLEISVPFGPLQPWRGRGRLETTKTVMGKKLAAGTSDAAEITLQIAPGGSAIDSVTIRGTYGGKVSLPPLRSPPLIPVIMPVADVYVSISGDITVAADLYVALTNNLTEYYLNGGLSAGLKVNVTGAVEILRVAKGYIIGSVNVSIKGGARMGTTADDPLGDAFFDPYWGGCAGANVRVLGRVGYRWFSVTKEFWRQTWGPWDLGGDGCAAGSGPRMVPDDGTTIWAADSVYVPEIFPFPSSASNSAGRVGAVWVSDGGSDPDNQEPDVFFVEQQDTSGNWGEPYALTEDDSYQSLSTMTYLADDTPLAVWVQSSLPRSYSGEDLTFSEMLDRQDLWFRARSENGEWAEARPIIVDPAEPYRADGLPALAAVGKGALMVWVRTAADSALATGSSEIYSSAFASGAWSDTTALTRDHADDTSPAVCGVGANSAVAVWVRADPPGFANESLVWSLWDGTAWGPRHALRESPWSKHGASLARAQDGRTLATWVETEARLDSSLVGGEAPDSTSRYHLMSSILDSAGSEWSVPEEVFVDSHFMEAPVALVDRRNIGVLIWRGYSGNDGDLFVSLKELAGAGGAWTLPREMSSDDLTDWMMTAALDDKNNLYAIDLKSDLAEGSVPSGVANFARGLSMTSRGIGGGLTLTNPISGLSTPRALTHDLQVASSAVSIDPPNPAVGDEVSVGAVVKNIGDVPSLPTVVRFFDGAPDSGGVFLPGSEVPLAGIVPDDSVVVHANWTVAAGPHRIFAVAVPADGGPEQNPDNNRAWVPVHLTPELSLDSLWIANTNPVPGTTDTVLVRVRNRGGAEAQGFDLRLGSLRTTFDPLTGLSAPPHGETTVMATFMVSPGVDTLSAEVDPDSLFADPDREDNRAQAPLRVLPDLAVASDSIRYDTDTGRIVASVANLGRVTSGPFMVRFYNGDPQVGGVALDSIAVDTLSGGASAPLGVVSSIPAGLNTVYVVADARQAIKERDEFNNETFQDLIITGVPNLRVVPGSLIFRTQSGLSGDLLATVRNTGNVNSFAVPVEFFLGDPVGGGVLLGDRLLPELAAGDSAIVSAPWVAPEQGRVTLLVVVDRGGTIIESDETDNQASAEFDHSAPVIAAPAQVLAEATGPGGAVVHFQVAAESPRCGPVPVICAPPSGSTFPLGETTVLCRAECEGAEVMATLVVRVVDTTPPAISCVPPIRVECSATGGTPVGDPQLVAFLAGTTATDLVDPAPGVIYEAPDLFGLGTTEVTFTATDAAGNASTCMAAVEVVDTTPPRIAVTLNRYALWPANHKLADIVARVSVSDVCDASPGFVLVSVLSDEPENGTGDGDTAPDLLGAERGTPDLEFQLRAERMARRDGRNYTITYGAADACGNEATASAVVRVPHDQAGGAIASFGFEPTGTGLDPESEWFALVVYSASELAEATIVNAGEVAAVATEVPDLSDKPTPPGFDASRIDVTRAYVGNLVGAIAPERSCLQDLNGDGLKDLAVLYPVGELQPLLQGNPAEAGPVGMHYETDGGANYFVPDIFALGPPVPMCSDFNPAGRGDNGDVGGIRRHAEGAAAIAPGDAMALPTITRVTSVHPNPFSGTVTMAFELAADQQVRLAIYDAAGRIVRTLVGATRAAGRYQERWDGRNEAGRRVPPGLYFLRFEADAVRQTHKVVLVN